MRIGFIGTGTIATAMVRGIAFDGHSILITERSQKNSALLSAEFDHVKIADAQTIIDQSDVIFVCLMFDVAREVLPGLTFQPDQKVFSAMVGIELAEFGQLVSPAAEVAILIPYPIVAQGGSPILVYPKSETLKTIFGTKNHIIELPDEAALGAYLAAQAVLSPIVKQLDQAADWLGAKTNDRHAAEKFLRILVGNSLTASSFDQPNVLGDMLLDLGTEGGLNAQLRDYFDENSVNKTLNDGLDILGERMGV